MDRIVPEWVRDRIKILRRAVLHSKDHKQGVLLHQSPINR